jgi:hypothetical protein
MAWRWAVLLLAAQSMTVLGLNFNITLTSLTNHNTSAYPAYNQANFPANFGTTSWVNQNGTTITIDPSQMDESLNPVTPGHVSKTDVHTLIPSRPDLRWFAHATPWFGTSSHPNIGLTNDTAAYVASMITDMKNRGFNGVVIDWYGSTDSTDGVVQKIKAYLAGIPGNTFTYIVMVDGGLKGGLGTNNFQTQIQYCQAQYFSDPNYEHEASSGGEPILMFFGVRSDIGETAMATAKAYCGGNMVWVEQGTSYLGESWEDECFEWADCFTSGVNASDPFNLSAVTSDFSAIKSSGKKAFGAMCSQFNGTLTETLAWSLGKYLPGSNGLCMVERAASINAAIPSNMTRMQWVTWSDWQEGSEVEAGIEDHVALTTQVTSNLLSWTVTAGQVQAIDHYEIYASANGVSSAFLVSVPTSVSQTNLSQLGLASGTYQIYVDAIGKPCVRDHLSSPATYVVASAPTVTSDLQPLAQTVWQGDPVSFAVTAGGLTPLMYQWNLNGQAIAGATNATYSFAALHGTNYYFLTITNQAGSVNSSTGAVVGAAGTFLNVSNYNGVRLTFSGYTNGETLAYFPVLVRLGANIPGFAYSQLISPATGADLRFVASDGRQLPSQIDQWNPSGTSLVWVQVPSITTTNDYLTVCWGNALDSAMPPSNTNGAVWTTLGGANDATLVYHFSQGGLPCADAALQYPANSGVPPALTTGMIGNGAAFNGSSQFLDAGLVPVGKAFTVSAWVNLATAATSEQTIWSNKQGGWATAGFDFYVNSWNASDGIIYFDTADGVNGNVSARTVSHVFSFGQWHLLTGALDGVNGAVHVYVDGVDQTINTGVDTAFQTTNYVRCGSLLTGTPGSTAYCGFDGSMDETRIENAVRSPAWVWASWATVADSAFASYGTIAPAVVNLQFQQTNGQVLLTWTTGTLQSAPAVNGPYTDLAGAADPYPAVPSGPQKYFRVRIQ